MIHAADKASCDKVAEAGYTNVSLPAGPLPRPWAPPARAPLCCSPAWPQRSVLVQGPAAGQIWGAG